MSRYNYAVSISKKGFNLMKEELLKIKEDINLYIDEDCSDDKEILIEFNKISTNDPLFKAIFKVLDKLYDIVKEDNTKLKDYFYKILIFQLSFDSIDYKALQRTNDKNGEYVTLKGINFISINT